MRKRPMLAYAILILGALASFLCYTRLSALLPMRDEASVTHTEATVTELRTPMIKKGETASDVVSQVTFSFHAAGKEIQGHERVRGHEGVPVKGAKRPLVYLNANPQVFLPEELYKRLPQQLSILRVLMLIFALVAIILPFVVLARGK